MGWVAKNPTSLKKFNSFSFKTKIPCLCNSTILSSITSPRNLSDGALKWLGKQEKSTSNFTIWNYIVRSGLDWSLIPFTFFATTPPPHPTSPFQPYSQGWSKGSFFTGIAHSFFAFRFIKRVQYPTLVLATFFSLSLSSSVLDPLLLSIRIRVQQVRSMRIRIRIQGFDEQQLQKIKRGIKKMQFTYS